MKRTWNPWIWIESRREIDPQRAPVAKVFVLVFLVAFLSTPLLMRLGSADGQFSDSVRTSIYLLGMFFLYGAVISFTFLFADRRPRRFAVGIFCLVLLIVFPIFVEGIRELAGW